MIKKSLRAYITQNGKHHCKQKKITEQNGSGGFCLRNCLPKLRVALHTGLNLIGIGTQSDEIFPVRACSEKAYAPIQKIKYSGDHDFHIYLRSHSICRPSPLLTNAFHTKLPPRYFLTFMQKSQRSLPRPSVMLLSQISFGCSPA